MITRKNFTFKNIVQFTGLNMLFMTLWVGCVSLLFEYAQVDWLKIPWLPISVIGTAVAFYIGFKNNSAYDRMWEARKIWGGIVNSSRAWGSAVKSFVTDQFVEGNIGQLELAATRRKLIYRHIAWLYALRSQLLVITEWEHANQGGLTGKTAQRYRKNFGLGLVDDEVTRSELECFLPSDEYERLINYQNTATQIIDQQSTDLVALRRRGIVEDFRHMELQKLLNEFYEHQGKCERIKKFPLPRQYGSSTSVFVGIFVFLLPFGMISAFTELGNYASWLAIPLSILIGWLYMVMDSVGDYSENPFQGMANDIPMLALCRTIEIDLREMLGETELPPAIASRNGILM